MTKEEKELLLKDLCARLPYGVIMSNAKERETYYPLTASDLDDAFRYDDWDDIPYLRLQSSMTEEEEAELEKADELSSRIFFDDLHNRAKNEGRQNLKGFLPDYPTLDWLNAHHFDYRGLIEKGLALKAPEEMYKIE